MSIIELTIFYLNKRNSFTTLIIWMTLVRFSTRLKWKERARKEQNKCLINVWVWKIGKVKCIFVLKFCIWICKRSSSDLPIAFFMCLCECKWKETIFDEGENFLEIRWQTFCNCAAIHIWHFVFHAHQFPLNNR